MCIQVALISRSEYTIVTLDEVRGNEPKD
ncbi:MAG: hypothetical protein ACI81P_003463 [Neolewinella sp.]